MARLFCSHEGWSCGWNRSSLMSTDVDTRAFRHREMEVRKVRSTILCVSHTALKKPVGFSWIAAASGAGDPVSSASDLDHTREVSFSDAIFYSHTSHDNTQKLKKIAWVCATSLLIIRRMHLVYMQIHYASSTTRRCSFLSQNTFHNVYYPFHYFALPNNLNIPKLTLLTLFHTCMPASRILSMLKVIK